MGSTNFLPWNPTQANQETDSQYAADSFRSAGAVGGQFPSKTGNKLYYQLAAFVSSFANMMAAKGYIVSDASLPALQAVLANLITSADLKPGIISVPYSPTPIFDASKANGFDITLAGNVTSSTLINAQIGQILTFIIRQPPAGGATFVHPANLPGWLPIDTAAGDSTTEQFIVGADGTIFLAQTYLQILQNEIDILMNPTVLKAQNGYRIDPASGILEQWGVVGPIGANSAATINFNIPFPNGCWNVQITPLGPGTGTAQSNNSVLNIVNGSFDLSNRASTPQSFNYRAIGF